MIECKTNKKLLWLLERAGRKYFLFVTVFIVFIVYGCGSSSGKEGMPQAPPPQELPVVTVGIAPATTYQEFSASLEGIKDIEIRPQVEGYLDRIFIDEGAHVKQGQVLFHINDRPYHAQLENAKASLAAARADMVNAQINVTRLTPLVDNNVISDVQLKTAKASYDEAKARVAQAQALVNNAEINLGYTSVKAPVQGYVGRIPLKIGSLVGVSTTEPLTVLSEIREIYAYFSLSENDFLQFKNQYPGTTVEEKIKQMPPVELVLADGSTYPQKGKVQVVSGQFNNSMGAISFRASFLNQDGLLRSGNTGKIRIPRTVTTAVLIPQEATFELQDKVFVFVVGDSNKVASVPIVVTGSSGNYYLVDKGVKAGDKIVYSGTDRLQDGAVIQPQLISMDSLLKKKPL
ncbi:efflux RND transporter periplasmic adaptor subunit [Flavisolibacter tropicus]|uniref:efflux RND transporter periplasmic adaptor subunit n=1 Tax=Flavisolibacter tropicus TaxID=1492898 RepID=UPI0009ED3713|nr:efflux RND transporter periplasmic adaptor subunit [Flavisolibacter tropicus]